MNKKLEQQKRLESLKAQEVDALVMGSLDQDEEQPEFSPLKNLPNGDIRCEICQCNMNSEPQALTHTNGAKHKRAMEKLRRSSRGRGRGRGGNVSGMAGRPIPLMQVDTSNVIFGGPMSSSQNEEYTESDNSVYNDAFEEALANNVDIQEAHRIAENARQVAVANRGFAADVTADDEEIVQPFLEEGEELDNSDPNKPRGIVVCKGYFRCDLCHVFLTCQADLQHHLDSPEHIKFLQMSTQGFVGAMPPCPIWLHEGTAW